MIEVAEAINSFASAAEQTDVPSSEEPIFVLTGSQLEKIISRAVQPLLDELDALKEEISLERAYDRKRITKLELKGSQKLSKTKATKVEILRSLLATRGGKMLIREARDIMQMDSGNFSRLLDDMADYLVRQPSKLDKRDVILVLKSLSTENREI